MDELWISMTASAMSADTDSTLSDYEYDTDRTTPRQSLDAPLQPRSSNLGHVQLSICLPNGHGFGEHYDKLNHLAGPILSISTLR